jgi:ATP-dependent helicase/DNAse subunit B
LNVKEPNVLEEIVEANTLGSIIHQTLEELYKESLNLILTPEILNTLLKKVPKKTKEVFSKEFKKGKINTGKNKLIYTVAEHFSQSFISKELSMVKSGDEIIIKAVEEVFKNIITIEGFDFPVFLNGNADRVDLLNGSLRIIDYKTGLVNPGELKSDDMRKVVRDLNYNKAFQLFFYAYLFHKLHPKNYTFYAGIISFRSLKKGFYGRFF